MKKPFLKDKKIEDKIIYTYHFKVNYSNELLNFLYSKIKDSRNNVKRLLQDHKVLVNGTMISQFNYPLAKDDEVKVSKYPIRQDLKTNIIKRKDYKKEINIIYEDEHFIAINKPSGLLSVQSDKDINSAYTLVFNYLKTKNINHRPYILHRIDKDTSGVLVFAKDIKIHSMLKGHWNDDIITREYYALVHGTLAIKEDTLKFNLKENTNNLVYVSSSGKPSITHYQVIKENNDLSLLRVLIDTGKKNQIRVCLKHIGYPIVGDDKYGDGFNPINRLGLHASLLEFIHPLTKKVITIKASLPKEFNL